jgi:hypothetical protein
VTAAASVNLRPSPSYTWDLWRIDGGLEEPVGLGRLDVRSSVRLP